MKAKSTQGKGIWPKIWRKPGTLPQDFSPYGVTRKCLIPPALNCDMWPIRETHGDSVAQVDKQLWPSMCESLRPPEEKAVVQHKPYSLYSLGTISQYNQLGNGANPHEI